MFTKLFAKQEKVEVPWNALTSEDQLQEIEKRSFENPVLIFKHSTRCSISGMVLSRFERSWQESIGYELYFLDLIAYRAVSNEIASHYQVVHESPQVLLLKDGKVIHSSSHMGINLDEIKTL